MEYVLSQKIHKGENFFDDFFDDFLGFPVFDDKEMQKAQSKLYGRHAANMMKTDWIWLEVCHGFLVRL